jgi:hypothetical protein
MVDRAAPDSRSSRADGRSGPADPAERPDAAQQLRLVAEQRARTQTALELDARVVLGAWGVAWFVGFGVFWLAADRDGGPLLAVPPVVVGLLFGLLLLSAATTTAVMSARATRGVSGASSRTGAIYSCGWLLGFAMLPAIVLGADRLGASPEATALLWPAVSSLVVGLMYVAGAAAFADLTQFLVGAWIMVTTGVGCLLGLPALYLVMCVAGGGGFLVAAGVLAVRQARRGTPVRA